MSFFILFVGEHKFAESYVLFNYLTIRPFQAYFPVLPFNPI